MITFNKNIMISSYYEDIFNCLLEYFPDYVCLSIVQFIKSSLNEDSIEEHKLDCNYFRICKNLGSPIPDLSKFMEDKYYHRHYSLQPNPLTNLYWKHIDVGPDHKDTLNQLHRCSLIDTSIDRSVSHQILDRAKGIIRNNHRFIYIDEPPANYYIYVGVLTNFISRSSLIIIHNYENSTYVNPKKFKKSLKKTDSYLSWHKIQDSHKDFVRKVNPKKEKRNRYKTKNNKYHNNFVNTKPNRVRGGAIFR